MGSCCGTCCEDFSNFVTRPFKTDKTMTAPTVTSENTLVNRPVFVKMICMRKAGKADTFSESDVYAKAALRQGPAPTAAIVADSIEQRWCTYDDEPNPIWNTTKFVAKKANSGNFLHLRFMDADATSDELLGEVALPVDKLIVDTVLTFKFPFVNNKSHIQEIDILLQGKLPKTKKNVIFIRHAESLWNESQANHNFKKMAERVDHPLTELGARQAIGLSLKLKEVIKKKNQEVPELPEETQTTTRFAGQGDGKLSLERQQKICVDEMLSAPKIYASPLCRATQTALLGLFPLMMVNDAEGGFSKQPQEPFTQEEKANVATTAASGGGSSSQKPKWIWAKNAREKRNFGGRDSSGTCFGKDYLPFIAKEVVDLEQRYNKNSKEVAASPLSPGEPHWEGQDAPVFPKSEVLADILCQIDPFETTQKWWSDSRESETEANDRIEEFFFEQLMWDEDDVCIVVGHSHYAREFLKHYFSKTFMKRIADAGEAGYKGYTLEQYQKWKLINCGCMHVSLDFSPILAKYESGKDATGADLHTIEDVTLILGTKFIP